MHDTKLCMWHDLNYLYETINPKAGKQKTLTILYPSGLWVIIILLPMLICLFQVFYNEHELLL